MTPERLSDCLVALGWTRRELATRLGVSERMVRHYLCGRSAVPASAAQAIEQWTVGVEMMTAPRLRAVLRALRLTPTEVAAKLGLPVGRVLSMMAGRRVIPPEVRQEVRSWF